jgi:hypothetical protein
MMTSFSSEDANELARMEALSESKPPSELKEVVEQGEKVVAKKALPDLKARLAALRARGVTLPPKNDAPLPTKVEDVQIVPGDMAHPQNQLEADVEAERALMRAAADPEDVEKASEKTLNAEALFTESLAEKSMDRDRFKAVFINTVQQECAGLTLDQIEESIRRDHEMLFDKRTGIQAKLAYRAELLKDATAEERAKRLKDDWLFKPNKKAAASSNGESKPKSSKTKSAPFDPAAAMKKALKAKGLSDEEITARLAKFGL